MVGENIKRINLLFTQFFKEEYFFIRNKEDSESLLKKLYDNLLVILRMDYSLNSKYLKNEGIKKLEGLDDNNVWESAFDQDNRVIFKINNNTFIFLGFLGHLCGLYNKNFKLNDFELLSSSESDLFFDNLKKYNQGICITDNTKSLFRLSCSKETSDSINQIQVNRNEIKIPIELMNSYLDIERRFIDFISNEQINKYVYPAMFSSVQKLTEDLCSKLFKLFSIKSKEYPTCLKLVMTMVDRLDVSLSKNNEYLINYYSYTLFRDIERVIDRTEKKYYQDNNQYVNYNELGIKDIHKIHYLKLQNVIRNAKERKVFLNVPYQDIEEVKSLGAKWDYEQKCWCISANEYTNNFDRWKIVESKKTVKHENILDDFGIHNKSKDYNKEKKYRN